MTRDMGSTSPESDNPLPDWVIPSTVTSEPEVARRKLSWVFAEEMAAHPANLWAQRALGSIMSVMAYVDDDPAVADMMAEAWELARQAPTRDQVWSRPGVAGVVVVAHGPTWSVVARSGGPVLLMADSYTQVLRLDGDPDWRNELTAMVTELIEASEGRDPTADLPLPPVGASRDHEPG